MLVLLGWVGCGAFLLAGALLINSVSVWACLVGAVFACSCCSVWVGWVAFLLAGALCVCCVSVWVCLVGAVCACSFCSACICCGKLLLASTCCIGRFSVWVRSVEAVCACSFCLVCVGWGALLLAGVVLSIDLSFGVARWGRFSLAGFARSAPVGARVCSDVRLVSVVVPFGFAWLGLFSLACCARFALVRDRVFARIPGVQAQASPCTENNTESVNMQKQRVCYMHLGKPILNRNMLSK